MVNYYEILGVQANATDDEIKKGYRKQALIWHPDKHQNSHESTATFKLIGEAYSVLKDPVQRRTYDLYGEEGLKRAAGAGADTGADGDRARRRSPHEFGGFAPDPFNVFREFFGGRDPFSQDFEDPFLAPSPFGMDPFGHGNLFQGFGFPGMGNGFAQMSSFGNMGGMPSMSSSMTSTTMVNGVSKTVQRETRNGVTTETITTRYPDGRVETTRNNGREGQSTQQAPRIESGNPLDRYGQLAGTRNDFMVEDYRSREPRYHSPRRHHRYQERQGSSHGRDFHIDPHEPYRQRYERERHGHRSADRGLRYPDEMDEVELREDRMDIPSPHRSHNVFHRSHR